MTTLLGILAKYDLWTLFFLQIFEILKKISECLQNEFFLESLELLWSILASEMCLWVVFFWGSFGIYTKIYVDNKDFRLTLSILSWILFWRLWTNFAYFLESFFPIDHVKARYCRNFFYYKNHFFLVIE